MNIRTENCTIEDNVYGLITQLSRHLLNTHQSDQQYQRYPYATCHCDEKMVKRLRAMAFGILLKKVDDPMIDRGPRENNEMDPILEVSKHGFALKLKTGRVTDADKLERLVEELETDIDLQEGAYSTLQLLIYLKNFKFDSEPITNVFSYQDANSTMQKIMCPTKSVPMFQIYPVDCFLSTGQFQVTPGNQICIGKSRTSYTNELSFHDNECGSRIVIGNNVSGATVLSNISSDRTLNGTSSYAALISPNWCTIADSTLSPLQDITVARDEDRERGIFALDRGLAISCEYLLSTQSQLIRPESESILGDLTWKSSNPNLFDDYSYRIDNLNSIWCQTDILAIPFSNPRTWEHFGQVRLGKEKPFATDLPDTAVHLAKIEQISIMPLLSGLAVECIPLIEQVPVEEFLRDMKSMLLGVESRSFEYKVTTGFVLRKNISVYGVHAETLETVCLEAIGWGNCFLFLSGLVTTESQTERLSQEGLIFKAMCTNIRELILYYRAALLRILNVKEKFEIGILKLLQRVRPVAVLITEVAKLCEHYRQPRSTLGEGSRILSRIYKEVTKVTDTKVALLFYSILKTCCEVYFRFLQKWMFEGLCDDIYGEFMIKTWPQYLRSRGHKFWTKSFTVCNGAVPGFLSELTEAILQCGKTVRLLRTCDSKNPVCAVCITEQPEVRVCLSVTSLHEQLARCKEYEEKGKKALGPIFSLSSAIQERKRAEREAVHLVVDVQRATLLRIHEERKEHLERMTLSKQDPFVDSKGQTMTEDVARKRTEQKEELRNNERIIDTGIDEEGRKNEATRDTRKIERTILSEYYEDLATEIEKRRARSQWRVKRMSHYEERLEVLTAAKRYETSDIVEKNLPCLTPVVSSDSSVVSGTPCQDENKNIAETETLSQRSPCERLEIVKAANEESQRSLTSYTNRRNNERSIYQEFLSEQQILEDLAKRSRINDTSKVEVTDKNETTDRTFQRAEGTERPTFLSIDELSNSTKSAFRIYDMTPNNNELSVPYRKVTTFSEQQQMQSVECVNANVYLETDVNCLENAPCKLKNTTDPDRGNELETPMSCTTDNFTSSIQSPGSQTQHSEDGFPMEISSGYASSFCRTPRSLVSKKDEEVDLDTDGKEEEGEVQETIYPSIFTLTSGQEKFPSSSSSASSINSLTMADVEVIDRTSLQVYLEKSIRIPLKIQSRLVNDAVIKYFLKEHDLLSHFHCLRSYFFLLNGEFAKVLTDSLYARLYQITIPVELFNSATLTNLLERALVGSFNSACVNSHAELLSLSAIDPPPNLHISDPNALDCLSLNYKIAWPLNIILGEMVMLQYGKVFKFLITSGRVSWVLQEDFNILKAERKAATSKQYHKLQLYRHSMTQFMNALHNYLTCSVLHASWAEFERDLQNSLTVDQIYLSHINYVKRILSRCMLNSRSEKIRACLHNIFKMILKFHNRLRSHSWLHKSTGYAHPNFAELEEMYWTFCELRTYMARVAFKFATRGYQPHLMNFLNALNINHLYDLKVKTGRTCAGPTEL